MSNCLKRLSSPVTWIEGECYVKDLISTLKDEITQASFQNLGGGAESNLWRTHYYEREHSYVTYTAATQSRGGKYTHDNGKESVVYKVPTPGEPAHKATDGYYYEAVSNIPVGRKTKDSPEYRTGNKISFEPFYHGGEPIVVEGALVTLVDMYPDRDEITFPNRWEKYQAYIVEHYRKNYLGEDVEDLNWNSYRLVAPMPDDWTYALHKGNIPMYRESYTNSSGGTSYNTVTITTRSSYSIQNFVFTPTLHRVPEKCTLNLMPSGGRYHSYIYMEKPLDSNNYIKISYLTAYSSKGVSTPLRGNPELSYENACTISNKHIPTIKDEYEAYLAYERQINDYYAPGEFFTIGDDGGTLGLDTDMVSYWYFSCNSSVSWLPDKMRDKYSLTRYSISLNNKRIIAVLEGDPGYDPDSAYISFAYMGEFKALSEDDNKYKFAVTVGMGAPTKALSGFDYKDIDKKTNPNYARYGRFTSNGMDSISVARGKSGLMYQEYHPAFLTHLPNYPTVGTIPKGLSRLDIGEYFQPSEHTEHYHSSPIYIAHGYEGYRGYLDGVVALYDVFLIDRDELDYQVENFTETYVVFKINTPISFLDKSAAPKNMILAILKEIKSR